ncbi:unnamed protein product [Brachionus calyciflorus]|uniref:Uncharacterized protein n=1 Tax=Brachionus calyciflorus TaxID=104777 RepID=A0A813MBN8_9BILA|nr:unnamed protein product [Brachionus calyciflorus]
MFQTIINRDRVKPEDSSEKDNFYTNRKLQIQKFEDSRKEEIQKFNEKRNDLVKSFQANRSNLNASDFKKTDSTGNTTTVALDASFSLVDNLKTKKPKHARKLIKEKLLYWSSNTTSHGIPNIVRLDSKVLKITWLICFLASLGYCIYTIGIIIQDFLQFDVLINQQVVTDSPIEFPAVTVCNLNPFDRRNAQAYIDKTLEKNKISYVNDINKIDINPKLVNTLIKSSIKGDSNLTSKSIENIGFHIDYMLLTCYFNDVPCNNSDFIWRYDFDYVNCYTFNSGFDQYGNKVPIKKVNDAGSDQSLKLELFLGYDLTQSQYILNSGARVVVHNQSVDPIISSEGIDVPTGFQTNLGIKRSFLFKLDSPYSDCIKDTKSPDSHDSLYYKSIFTKLNMTIYRQKICMRLCLQDFILRKCACLDGSLPNIFVNETICQDIDSLECVADSRMEYFSSQESSSCSQCPLECDSSNFQMTASSSRYPTRYYQNYLSARTNILSRFPTGTSASEITKSTVLLNVFYEDLATTYTNEIPAVTPVSLLGNVGGNLGLFIGISLLTFVEIIEFLIELFFILFNKIFKN